jgi:hypothetical protein
MHSLPPTRLPHYNHVDHAIATFHMLLISNATLLARVLSTPVESNFHPPTPSTATELPTTMAPAAKRRKVAAPRFECHTCLETLTTGKFPDYNPTETCDHLINTCTKCLKEWIQSQIETAVFTPHIPCPQCNEKMNNRDVDMAVPKSIFSRYVVARLTPIDRSILMMCCRYVELERNYIAENTPGWRWCLAPGCQSGQVHVSPASTGPPPQDPVPGSKAYPIKVEENKGGKGTSRTGWISKSVSAIIAALGQRALAAQDVSTCNDCGAKACVPCDRPWHEHETCEEYQLRIKDRLQEEDASLAFIQKQTKDCPKCSKSIEKNGGCRHMYCTQCKSEFCWECVQLINWNGQYCGCGRVPGQ